jgi:hypothetical protein
MSSLIERLYANWSSGLPQKQLEGNLVVGSNPTSRTIKKAYGPYDYSDGSGRKLVIIIYIDGSRKTIQYAKYLWENKYGPVPAGFEVHHKNEKVNDDRLSNLELISANKHRVLHAYKGGEKMYKGICPVCNRKFTKRLSDVKHNRKNGRAGPFCGRSCAGKYSVKP